MNWKLYSFVTLVTLSAFVYSPKLSACGFDFTSSCGTFIDFSVNNITTEYYATPCTYNSAIPSSFGSAITNFKLTFASTRTWESCTNNVNQSAIYYRIFKDATNKGLFKKADLTQLSLFSSPPYRTKTYSNALNIDLLAGLAANTAYTIEIYFQLGVDTDGNGSIDQFLTANNAGNFYTSAFRTGNLNNTPTFPINITSQDPTCNGGNNGSATAVATGGKEPYTYIWSNNATTAAVSNLAAGVYYVTVTDAANVQSSNFITINNPSPISANLTTVKPDCGQSNGSISATGSGGLAPYEFTWSTSATTPSVSNLAAGNYSVTVKDANNCSSTSTASLLENCGTASSACNSNSQAPWNEWIATVKLSNLNNVSEKARSDKYALGYSDWKDKAATVAKGNSYPLSITPGLSWSGYNPNLYYHVWIDFNRNGTFETTEQVFEKSGTTQAVTGTIIIPTTALTGTTLMRVSMKKDAYSTACETFPAGEVEDYSITIQGGTGNPCANDVEPPVFTSCPTNISLTTYATTAAATWATPTATDNCTNPIILTSNYNSGQNFPVGNTSVQYVAKDSSNNQATCSFSVTVTFVDTTTNNACKSYSVSNTNAICQQTWLPYGMILVQNNQNQYLHAQQVTFENSGTTAVLRGTFRTSSWAAVQVTVNLSGGTAVAPSGSPRTSSCSGNASNFTYFTSMSGTVIINGQTLTIAGRGAAFQVGNGADLQNATLLGASGQFTLSDNTIGEFGFKLTNAVSCTSTTNLAATKPVLQFFAKNNVDKADLKWINNTNTQNDYYEIQKLDEETGLFKTIDFVNEKFTDNQLHEYHFTDINPNDGDNIYRIKTVFLNGKSIISDNQTVRMSRLNDVLVYPNPAFDEVSIRLKSVPDSETKILIYNNLGNVLKTINANNQVITTDISELPTGQYFIRTIAKGKRDSVQRFQVIK